MAKETVCDSGAGAGIEAASANAASGSGSANRRETTQTRKGAARSGVGSLVGRLRASSPCSTINWGEKPPATENPSENAGTREED